MKLIALALMLFAAACLPQTSTTYETPTFAATPTTYGTGVFINGHELTADEKAQFEGLIGDAVPAARYTIDANGMMGYEGQAPLVNITAVIQARQQQGRSGNKPINMYSTDASGQGSSIVSEGGCTILSTPTGSLSSGC
jgi:hypothetical protein